LQASGGDLFDRFHLRAEARPLFGRELVFQITEIGIRDDDSFELLAPWA
jgi:hypothetical protein